MPQITIRNLEPELESKIREAARKSGLSLNKVCLRLLRKGMDMDSDKTDRQTIGSSLDSFMGTWSEDEERELLDSIDACEMIDEELWQ